MSYTTIKVTDTITAENHPTFADIKNRAAKEIHARFIAEHDSNGKHLAWNNLVYSEFGTFTGDGTDDRTIDLTDTELTPKFVQVLEIPPLTATGGGSELLTNPDFATDLSSWGFTYGDSDWVNEGRTNGCCRMWQGGGNPQLSGYQQVSVTIGTPYVLSFWYKTRSGSTDKGVYLAVEDGTLAREYLAADFSTADWVQMSATFTPTYNYMKIVFGVSDAGFSNYILFDDMSVKEVTGQTSTQKIAAPYMIDALLDGDFYALNPTYGILSRGYTTGYGQTGFLKNFQKGSFDVSYLASHALGEHINTDDAVNYYMVLGTHADTYAGNTGGTDPDWVEDGEQMLGGIVGTEPGNQVENHIDTQLLVEHNQDGTHSAWPFDGYMAIETGETVATGAQEITVTLENPYIDIAELWIFSSGRVFWSATKEMTQPATKKEQTAAFDNAIISDISKGEFTFLAPASGFYWWMALGELSL